MCKAPKVPKPKEPKKPQFLRNKYLDEFVGQAQAVMALRTGRSQLRIPLGSPTGIGGRQPGEPLVATPTVPITTGTNNGNRPPGMVGGDVRSINPRRRRQLR